MQCIFLINYCYYQIMNKLNRILSRVIILSLPLALLLVFVILTDPRRLPLPLLVMPFILLFAFIYKLIKSVLLYGTELERSKSWTIVAAVGALVPTFLLMFQSIHQLTVRDVLVVISLGLVTAFYVAKADFIR